MDNALLTQLAQATTDAERESIILDITLSTLPDPVRTALNAAAIPHWFDYPFLEAMLGEEAAEEGYEDLFDLTFVEDFPGRGYAIHEATRHSLLDKLWQADPHQFRTLSQKAADYCATQAGGGYEANQWRSEEIYHKLVANPEAGFERFQEMATAWANYEQSSLEQIERLTQLAREQVKSGRLSAAENNLVRYWQARLALLYGRTAQAADSIGKVTVLPSTDPHFAADLADLRGDIFAAQNNLNTAKQAWLNASDLYQQNGRSFDQYLVREKLHTHNLLDDQPEETPTAHNPPDKLTLQLLDNIEDAWINGVLKEVFKDGNQSLDLPKARGSDSLLSGRLRVRRSDGLDQNVTGSGLSGLFEASGHSLLILGAPGSGKTITLLQLLNELIQKARANSGAPVPLLFNLSSFGNFEGSFIDWLAEQAYNQYRLNRLTTKNQLNNGRRFILLLDGLDEIPNQVGKQDACVGQINRFIIENPCGIIICSRFADYKHLDENLHIEHAILLQPLSNAQIQTSLPKYLQELLRDHWQLNESLRSPLLLALFPQAFLNNSLTIRSEPESIVDWQRAIFEQYAKRLIPATGLGQTYQYLSYMANNMQMVGTTVFNIEDLQPNWLRNLLQGRWYKGLAGALLGLFIGLAIGLSGGLSTRTTIGLNKLLLTFLNEELESILIGGTLEAGILERLTVSLIILGSGVFGGFISRVGRRQNVALAFVGIAIVCMLLLMLPRSSIRSLIESAGILTSYFYFFNSWSIELKEKITPALPKKSLLKFNFRRYFTGALLMGLFLGWSMIRVFIADAYGSLGRLIILLAYTLFFGLNGALVSLILSIFETPSIDQRSFPGDGVVSSLRSSLYILFATVLGISLLNIIPIFLIGEAGVFSFLFSLTWLAPIMFTFYGGMAWCQHWALRFILYWHNYLPFRLVLWLNNMVEIGIMRRVGGGYIFLHRSLLEYFANLDTKIE